MSDKLLSRLGWQPRCKPTVLASGRILLPLYSDTYSAGIMAISDDGGKTWTASQPLAGFGSIQPAVLERKDGTLVAYMRENGVFKKVRACESKDKGETWGTVYSIDIPNPGSGLDAVRLASGNWLLIYNDTQKGRDSLAVSLSDDEGKTWKWTRHLEKQDTGSYHYPAIIQAKDGAIHAVYSYFVKDGKSMKHARFNEAWVKAGDGKIDSSRASLLPRRTSCGTGGTAAWRRRRRWRRSQVYGFSRQESPRPRSRFARPPRRPQRTRDRPECADSSARAVIFAGAVTFPTVSISFSGS